MGDLNTRRRALCNVGVICLLTALYACQPKTSVSIRHPVGYSSRLANAPVPDRPTLVHTLWRIVTIEQQAVQTFVQQPHVMLQANATLSGSTGCNTLTGRYTLGASNEAQQHALSLHAVAAHQFCQGALLQEARLFNALDHVRFAKIQGQQLLLLDARQAVLVVAVSPSVGLL